MRTRLIFAVSVTVVAGLVYFTPLDMLDGRDLPNHGLPTTTTTATIKSSVATTSTTAPAPPPVTLPPPAPGAKCPHYWDLAQVAGWTYQDLETAVDLIMWRESRCLPEVRSRTRDSGLLQINDIHLEHLAGLGISAEMLFDPFWNLVAGLEVARLAESYGWNRFQPWTATYP
jgi:soluble lytic murein transglycosylase-like protein